MPDLFSVMIPAALSSAASWVTKRMLEAIAGCPSCGRETERAIPNGATTNVACASCSHTLGQYSIATDNTVRRNGRLICANIFNPVWEMRHEGVIFKKHTGNWFILDIHTVGMEHHGMIVKAEFKDLKSGKIWPAGNMYLNNATERTSFLRQGWLFASNAFPSHSAIVADVKVETIEGDVLHSIAPLANFAPAS